MKRIVPFLLLLCSCSYASEPKQSHLTFSADVLYWKLREGSADNWAQIIPAAGSNQNIKVIDVPFKNDAGYRLGIHYTPKSNAWNASTIYTSYQTTGRNEADGRVYSAFLGNFYIGNTDGSKFGPYYDHGEIRWHFSYKTVDVVAGREFTYKNTIILHPTVGIKTALINQKIFSSWRNPSSPNTPPDVYNFTNATEDLQNDFVAVGPSLGLRTTWPLIDTDNMRFSLLGDFQGALMWSYWRFKDIYKNDGPARVAINSNNINGASTMMGLMLGAEWSKTYPSTKLALRVGYEAQIWFNQLQYYSYNMGRLNNLMSLQGGTLKLSADIL